MSVDGAAILKNLTSAEQLDLFNTSILQLQEAITSGELALMLEQPKKSATQKKLYVEKLLDSLPSPELREALTAASGDLSFFERKAFTQWTEWLQNEAEKIEVLQLTTAVNLKPADRKAAIKLISARMGQPLVLQLTVDSSLIGGAIIRHGTYISDFSLKTRLEQFRVNWRSATVIKKK